VNWRAWCAFVALGIFWGIPYFLIKLALTELTFWDVAWIRLTCAAAVLLPIAWRRGALRGLRPRLRALVVFALAEFAVPFAAISLAERWIDSAVTGILIAVVPILVTLLGRFFGVRERLRSGRVLGLAVGLAGVVSLLGFGTITWPYGWVGVALLGVATTGYALGPLVIQRDLAAVDSVGALTASLLIASAVLAAPALATLPAHLPGVRTLAAVAVLGIVCTASATLLLFFLVSQAGAARALVITYINPAVATLLGVALLHERLGRGGAAGLPLILVGSWLATRGRAARTAAAPTAVAGASRAT
jgi:drug/metabolite transporter (DMT)-like permease